MSKQIVTVNHQGITHTFHLERGDTIIYDTVGRPYHLPMGSSFKTTENGTFDIQPNQTTDNNQYSVYDSANDYIYDNLSQKWVPNPDRVSEIASSPNGIY